ncbi:hypothetical protein COB55_04475 [Candidatus Wolfebacteria bacterium]|nr:MAG: hypothetical protein COB55_04475 [Candidatus Wolfebacteria bacterium]
MGLLSEIVETRVNGNNKKHLEDVGYKNLKGGEIILILVEHLTKGSYVLVWVECDFCGIIKQIPYHNYLRSMKNHEKYSCFGKCSYEKTKLTKLEKHGDPFFNNPEKNKQTKLERHGDENYNNPDRISETHLNKTYEEIEQSNKKREETMMEISGVTHNWSGVYGDRVCDMTKLENHGDINYNNREKFKETCLIIYSGHPMQNAEVRKKSQETKLERHGDPFFNNMEKSKQTNLKNLGVEYTFQSEEIIEKSKETKRRLYGNENYTNREQALLTNISLYGVEYPFQLEFFQEKYKQTCLERFGVEHPSYSFDVIKKQIETKTGMKYEEYLERIPDWELYKKQVLKFTRRQSIYLLESVEKRGLSGVNGSYQLDHMFTIYEGFKQNICPYIIGNICNLIMLPWEDNISKYVCCSLTKQQLFDRYDNRDKLLEQLTEDYNKR